jgi:acetyl-CoA carboxylase biotin carboxyl carrier protein
LKGEQLIGIYPLLKDNTSWFIAADFDKAGWENECKTFLNACIEKLAKVIAEQGLTEIYLEDGEQAIVLKKEKELVTTSFAAPVAVSAPASASAPAVAASIPAEVAPVKKGKPVTSPMVGTFYEASSPGAPAFVSVGQSVSNGQVVCIIEAMKLMNEIEAEVSGKITEICVKNGEPVEFGQVLMYVE